MNSTTLKLMTWSGKEVEVYVEYNYTPAKPGKYGKLGEPGDPPEPAEIEILKIEYKAIKSTCFFGFPLKITTEIFEISDLLECIPEGIEYIQEKILEHEERGGN